MGSICIPDTLRALSDDKSLTLFNIVAFTLPRDSGVIMTRLGLNRKEYYSRMNRLIRAGLVMRKNGEFLITSLGKVVYESHKLIGQATKDYWKLKAIDSIETMLADHDLPFAERKRIIDTLIKKVNIRNILLNLEIPSNQNDRISDRPRISATPTTPEITVIEK